MTITVRLILWALVSYWVSSAFGWRFWTVAIGLGVLVGGYSLAQHFGWFRLRPAPSASGGGVSARMTRFLVGFSTLTFVMMVGTKVIDVSNNYAFTYFLGLGPRPWLYPAGITTDLLIWVALFFISVVIAGLTANDRMKPALWIFGLTLAFLFTAREMPRLGEMARPKAATPMRVAVSPPPANKWEETDQAASERGTVPTAFCVGYQWAFGPHWPCTGGNAVSTVKGAISSMLPAPAPSAAAVSAPAPAPASRDGLTPTLYQFGPDGCLERNFGYQTRWYPKEGAMRVFRPDGSDYVDSPGVDTPITNFGPGRWRFCRENLGATGVEIWE